MCKWPINPVKVIAAMLKTKSKDQKLNVADFGCGDAYLARTLCKTHNVHSFDMVSTSDIVTACDMAHVPLKDSSMDVAVFCLSLMGTNLRDFVAEAFRVLKPGADLIVAEVKSRFVVGGNESSETSDVEGIRSFTKAMKKMHFKLVKKDASNKMFVLFRFRRTKKKDKIPPSVFEWNFKPCLYKKR